MFCVTPEHCVLTVLIFNIEFLLNVCFKLFESLFSVVLI